MAAKRQPPLSPTDHEEWARYARLVRPMAGRVVPEPLPESDRVAEAGRPESRLPPLIRSAARSRAPASVVVGEQPAGVDRATWTRLKAGKLGRFRTLDLHGLRVQPAYDALVGFVRAAHADRVRCVEIVTGLGSGEGGGVIRREFPLWLTMPPLRPLVLAAAHPHAANQGAVRLLLRQPREAGTQLAPGRR